MYASKTIRFLHLAFLVSSSRWKRLWAMREKREKMSEEDLDYDLVAADVWGCGIILFFMLTAGDPFPTQKPARTDPRFLTISFYVFRLDL